jgi:NADP-dependent 3-hydroxy acid dehydrogenase YdfG
VNTQVVVVIGAGGIGQAIARRKGAGKTVLLGDRNEESLASAAQALESGGHRVATSTVDVS